MKYPRQVGKEKQDHLFLPLIKHKHSLTTEARAGSRLDLNAAKCCGISQVPDARAHNALMRSARAMFSQKTPISADGRFVPRRRTCPSPPLSPADPVRDARNRGERDQVWSPSIYFSPTP